MTEQTDTTETPIPAPTVHGFVITNAAEAEQIAEAIERVRPLDAEQRKNLLDILQEDADEAARKIREAFDVERRRVKAEVVEQHPDPVDATEVFRAEAEALLWNYQKAMRKLNKKAAKSGVSIDGPLRHHGITRKADLKGMIRIEQTNRGEFRIARDKAIEEATAPLDLALIKALGLLSEQRAKANRQIRLASVSKDAGEILHTLPSVESIISSIGTAVDAAKTEIEEAAKAGHPVRQLLSKVSRTRPSEDPSLGALQRHGIEWDQIDGVYYQASTGRRSVNWRDLAR